MIRKAVKWTFLGAVAVAAAVLVSRGAIGSYVRMAFDEARHEAKNLVPLEWELKRANQMIARLEPEIERNVERVVREQIEVAKLRRQLEKNDQQLAQCKREVLRLRDDLASGSTSYVYAGRSFTEEQVRADLANRFDHFKDLEAVTEKLRKILSIRETKLQAAKQRVDAMRMAKRKLEVEIEHLAARLEMVQVAQTTSDFHFDDSQLSQTRELLDEIETRLDVNEQMLQTKAGLVERIPLGESDTSSQTIAEDVTRYFGGSDRADARDRSTDVASTGNQD